MNGWLSLYKDSGMSSFKALSKVRKLLSFKKIGHGGTLDPLAEGILPLAFGKATRTVSYLMNSKKTYVVTIGWGKSTTTDDKEGQCLSTSSFRPSKKDVVTALKQFTGIIDQRPPKFSAIHINGVRAYTLARKNICVNIPTRKVTIYSIKILSNHEEFSEPDFTTLLIKCGKGTYIRSLARDLGEHLSSPAHVVKLKRIVVGPFNRKNCLTYAELYDNVQHNGLGGLLLPTQVVLNKLPVVNINDSEAENLKHGRHIEMHSPINNNPLIANNSDCENEVSALFNNQLIAIAHVKNGLIYPKRVF